MHLGTEILRLGNGSNTDATFAGTLTSDKHTINSANDAILTLNQTGADTGWNYIEFNTLGGRQWYVGMDNNKNFDIYNDNIDSLGLTIDYTNNNATIGGDLTVSGGDIILSGTGRIQGIDTVSASTDAANKAYVDAHVSPAGTYLPLAGGTMTTTAKIYFYNTSQYIHANSNNDLTIASGDDINYLSNFSRFYTGGLEFARLSGSNDSWIANGTNSKLGVNKTDPDYNLDVEGTLRTTSTAIFEDKVGIGMTPVEVLDLKAASGDTRVRLDAASGSDTEVKFFNAGAAQYTIGHDDATDNFVIGGANVDAPLVSVNKAGVLIINGGNISLSGTGRIQGIDTVSASTDAANKAYVDAHVSPAGTYLPLIGGTMSGNIVMGDNDITGIDQLTFSSGTYLTDVSSNYVQLRYASADAGGIIVLDGDGTTQGYLYADGNATSSFGLLDGSGSWAVKCAEDAEVELRYDNVKKFQTTNTGIEVSGRGYFNATDANTPSPDDVSVSGYGLLGNRTTNPIYFHNFGDGGVRIATNVALGSAGGMLVTGSLVTVDGGNILLSGTGRIQGIDTVSASTDAASKNYVDTQIATIPSGLNFQGNWNASTNSPTLASGTGTPGFYYNVSVAGTTDLDGETDWQVGDWAVFVENDANDFWEKIDNTSALTGVGANNQVSLWGGTNTLEGTTALTFTGGDLYVTGDGNSSNWYSAYQDTITAFSDSGSSTITLTLTQRDGGTLTTSFSNPQGTVTGTGTNDALPMFNSAGTGIEDSPFAMGNVDQSSSNTDLIIKSRIGHHGNLKTAFGFINTDQFIIQLNNVMYFNMSTSRLRITDLPVRIGNTVGIELYNFNSANLVTLSEENGNFAISTIPNATSDTDKFLVSDGGEVKYRTGAQVLSDIGGAPATGGAYLPLVGGTMSGNIAMGDNDITGIDELKFNSGTKLGDGGGTDWVDLTYANSGDGGLRVKDINDQVQGYLYGTGGVTSDFGLLTGAGEWAVRTIENGLVELRHDNAVKLQTTSTGISVTGRTDVNGTGEMLKLIDSSATGNPKMSFYQVGNERAYIQYADTGEKLIIDSDSDLVLNTNNLPRLTIDSTGLSTFAGNVSGCRCTYHK